MSSNSNAPPSAHTARPHAETGADQAPTLLLPRQNALGNFSDFQAAELYALYDKAPLGLAMMDRDLRFVRINQTLAEINGFSVEAHIGQRVWDLLPDLQNAAEPLLRGVLDDGVVRRDVMLDGETPARPGVKRQWREQFYPVTNSSNDIVGLGIICEEITTEASLQEELKNREVRLRRILNGCVAFIGVLEPDGELREANATALNAGGLTREDVIGRKFWDCPWWSHDPAAQARLKEAIAQARAGEMVRYDAEVRTAGDTRLWIDFMLSPVLDGKGNVEMIVPSGFDITARIQHERHRDLLIDELNHRVKNMLAIVQSIANQTLRPEGDRTVQRWAFQGRLHALAGAMDLLTEAHWQNTSMRDVAKRSLRSAGSDMGRVLLEGPVVELTPKAAVTFAMAFHELATNARKYGALSDGGGRVELNWSRPADNPNGIQIRWSEHDGPPVAKPEQIGFGSRMIERVLSQELRGTAKLHFGPTGLICDIEGELMTNENQT